jgi:hypothetical protein
MPLNTALQLNDTGIDIIATVVQQDNVTPVDMSLASTITIYIYRPDGALITGTATVVTNGKDGQIQYITQPTDLTVQGVYKIQAKYTIGGNTKRTDINTFCVEPNLPGVS